MNEICPVCEKGSLSAQFQEESFAYDGAQLAVPGMEFSFCSVCGEEVVLPDQGRRNSLRIADAKRRHDGLLTSDEIAAIRELWGLTQQKAAALFGGGQNAFSKYERGEVMQARSMDILLRAYNEVPELRAYISGDPAYSWCVASPVKVQSAVSSAFAEWIPQQFEKVASIWEEVDCDEPIIVSIPQRVPAQPAGEARTAKILGGGRQWGKKKVAKSEWFEDFSYVAP